MTGHTERFEAAELDRSVWVPWYLPHWSSRATSAATYRSGGGELRLSIPADQPLWAEDVHSPPLRVFGVQSANFSGPVGSTIGGQPFLPGQQIEDTSEHSAEILVMEVFGTAPRGVGMGLRRFRDPRLTD